jgi:hypothetical protein
VIAAWRQERAGAEPIEHVCGRLLLKVCRRRRRSLSLSLSHATTKVRAAHQQAAAAQPNNALSAPVAAMIDSVLTEFYQVQHHTAASVVVVVDFVNVIDTGGYSCRKSASQVSIGRRHSRCRGTFLSIFMFCDK